VALEQIESTDCCVVLDLRGPQDTLSIAGIWMPIHEIQWNLFELSARNGLRQALRQIRLYAEGTLSGRFTLPGWFDEISKWTEKQLVDRGLRLTGRSRQFNMGPDFSLVRYETSGASVWFKAVGEPNLREFDITTRLAELRLPHIPEVLCTHASWRAWLMFEARGNALDECGAKDKWPTVANSLAHLQLASVPHTTDLLDAGCIDLRTTTIASHIEPYLSSVSHLMSLQTSTQARRLVLDDLHLMERQLRASCRSIEALALPESIGHCDFNAGNVFVDRGEAVFLDWAQAYVGTPFLMLEYLLLLVRRSLRRPDSEIDIVRQEYLGIWEQRCSPRKIADALKFIPLLAAFSYALVCGGSQQKIQEGNRGLAGYLRALARRIHLEAEILEQRRNLAAG